MTNSTEPSNAHTTRQETRTRLSSSDEQDDVGTEVPSKLAIELMTAMPAADVKLVLPKETRLCLVRHGSRVDIAVLRLP
jgi:hypothetical protein